MSKEVLGDKPCLYCSRGHALRAIPHPLLSQVTFVGEDLRFAPQGPATTLTERH